MASTASRLADVNSGATYHYYVRIEGCGLWDTVTSTSRGVYIFSRIPDWTQTSVKKWVDGLHIPGNISSSIDAIGGVESANTLDIEFEEYFTGSGYQDSPLWGSFFASSRALYAASTSYPATRLGATLNHTATTATTVTGGTAAFDSAGQIFIGNECITYSGKGASTFTGLARGRHKAQDGDESRAYHAVNAATDFAPSNAPDITTTPYTWYGRRIALYMFHRDPDNTWGTEAESLLVWKGRIRSNGWTGTHWKFSCQSIIADLDRPFFSISNPPRRTTGFYASNDTTAGVGTFGVAEFYNSVGTHVSADDYTFSLSTNFFGSWDDFGAEIMDRVDNGGSDPHLWFDWGAYPDGPNFSVTTSTAFRLCKVQLPWTIRFLLRDQSGGFLPQDGFDVVAGSGITGDFERRQYCSFIDAESAFVIKPGVNESLRVDDGTDFVTDQGDLGTAMAYVKISMSDDRDPITASITAQNGAIPTTLTVRAIKYSGSTIFYASAGRSDVRQCFRPTTLDGLGEMFLRIMVSTGGGTTIHGSRDVLPLKWGAGIDPNDIDVASFSALDSIFPEMTDRTYEFVDSMSVRELLEQEAKLLGFFVVLSDGKITLKKAPSTAFRSGAGASVTLNESNQDKELDRPSFAATPDTTFNVFKISTNWDVMAEEFRGSPIMITNDQSRDVFGEDRVFDIENRGLREATAENELIAPLIGRLLMFSYPFPKVQRTLSWDLFGLLNLGDLVFFTDRSFPNPFGSSYGVNNLVALVDSLGWDFTNRRGRCTLRLFPNDRVAPLAPSAEVASYAASVLTLEATTFGGNGSGGNDALMFDAGDKILVAERNPLDVGSPIAWIRTISSRTSTTITLTSALSSPAFDSSRKYFVTFADYATVQGGANASSQSIEASFIADGTDGLIQTYQDFYVYT